jgi:glycerol-3-phosphate dehydrogenase
MNQGTAVLDPGLELPDEVHEHLARRYGGDAREVVAIAAADARLARPVVMAPELGWSSERTFREGEAWTRLRCPP